MFNSLKFKFIISFISLEFVFFIIIISINFNSIDKSSETLVQEKVNTTSQLLVELLKTPLIVYDLGTIDDIVLNFSNIENVVAVEVKGINSKKYATNLREDTIPRQYFEEKMLNTGTLIFEYNEKEYIYSSSSINVEGEYIGDVFFIFDTTHRMDNINKNKYLSYVTVFFALVIGIILALLISGNLSKSIKSLIVMSYNIAHEKKVDIPDLSKQSVEVQALFKSMITMQSIINERTDKLNQFIELFGDNVIASSSDINGKITYASQALCTISGYTQEELLGKPHSILRHNDMSPETFKELWENLLSAKSWYGEIKNSKKDGGYYWVNVSILPEYDSNNNMIGFTSIRHDITAQKVKEEFMANMSHELRTPLNAIIGFSTLLCKRLTDKEELLMIENINSSSKNLLSLINDILDLSKIQDTKFNVEPYAFYAFDELHKSCQHFKGLLAHKKITMNNTIDENTKVTLLGDWYRINQVVLNIISNAIKFTEMDGQICLNANYQKKHLILSVSDNGIGMTKVAQDKIFEPFEQADGSTTRKYGGTGLGLSITQSLVELMHGTIEVESQVGEGTTFRVTIPLSVVKEVEEIESKVSGEKSTLSGHLLVVEDNTTNQLLITMVLDELGVTCDIANNGVEAVELFRPSKHKIILMDENMPIMNGIEAMKALHKKHKEKCAPIIALTANAMSGDRERFLKLGMDGYIAKPIDNDELYYILENFL